jgi:alpha-tubulin suppressor-like RCC1 family protein
VYSIGDNRFGQLGIGRRITVSIDTPMLVGVMKKWSPSDGKKNGHTWYNERVVKVAAGQYHSACVTDQGSLYTWG